MYFYYSISVLGENTATATVNADDSSRAIFSKKFCTNSFVGLSFCGPMMCPRSRGGCTWTDVSRFQSLVPSGYTHNAFVI